MNKTEKKLAAKLLQMAADKFVIGRGTMNRSLQRVFRVLSKGVPLSELALVLKPQRVLLSRDSSVVLMLLPRGRWAGMLRHDDLSALSGCIGGYNCRVGVVVDGLTALDAITAVECAAFHEWFHEENAKNSRNDDIKKMSELAKKHGYKLQKEDTRR